jgi:hypothetical protein
MTSSKKNSASTETKGTTMYSHDIREEDVVLLKEEFVTSGQKKKDRIQVVRIVSEDNFCCWSGDDRLIPVNLVEKNYGKLPNFEVERLIKKLF